MNIKNLHAKILELSTFKLIVLMGILMCFIQIVTLDIIVYFS